jgi:hypothetical protein
MVVTVICSLAMDLDGFSAVATPNCTIAGLSSPDCATVDVGWETTKINTPVLSLLVITSLHH